MVDVTTETGGPLYSIFGSDPDLGEIIELFVNEMPDRVARLLNALDAGDWEVLRRSAHQLKGAAGSYGFHPISASAERLEDALRENEPSVEIRRTAHALVDLCNSARAGAPQQDATP